MVDAICYGVRAVGAADDYKLGVAGSEAMISTHNRQVKTQPMILCAQTRTGSGTLVRDVIGEKQSWKFSFRSLPNRDEMTVDGGMGCKSLRELFTANLTSLLVLKVPTEDGAELTYNVVIDPTSFMETVISRMGDNWKSDIEFTLIEV
jgi:hypothetical protein